MVLSALLVAFASPTLAGVPQAVSVQGYLEDSASHAPINGQVDFCVCLYDAETGGIQVWPLVPAPCQRLNDVPVEAGLLALVFGDADLTPQLWGDPVMGPRPLWAEISTADDAQSPCSPMTPRITLRTAPYAFRAGFVDSPELTDQVSLGNDSPGSARRLSALNSAGIETFLMNAHNDDGASIVRMWNGQTPNIETIRLNTGGGAAAGHALVSTALGIPAGSGSKVRALNPDQAVSASCCAVIIPRTTRDSSSSSMADPPTSTRSTSTGTFMDVVPPSRCKTIRRRPLNSTRMMSKTRTAERCFE